MNTTFNSLSTDNKKQLLRFNYDYFFHYMLINSDDIRLSFCCYISGDDSITSTVVINSETYKPRFDGKKLILDVVVKDDKERIYDFEMQTDSISTIDEIHFIRYGDRLLDVQEKRGVILDKINDVFQLIFYCGDPLSDLKGYENVLRKRVKDHEKAFRGDKVKMVILQLKKLEEEKDMETTLNPIDQLGYLFLHDRAHEKSKKAKIVEEAEKIHEDFLKDEKEFIHACEIERERMVIEVKMSEREEIGRKEGLSQGKELGRKEGLTQGREEGIAIEKLRSTKNMIEVFYGKHNLTWLEELQNEKLDLVCTMISQGYTYEQLKEKLQG